MASIANCLKALTEIDKFKKKIRKIDLARGHLMKDICGSQGQAMKSFLLGTCEFLTHITLVYCCT